MQRNATIFSGACGCAGGNFGIVSDFEYRLHPVGQVLGRMILYPVAEEILHLFDEFSNAALTS
jgi:hypothetical protein